MAKCVISKLLLWGTDTTSIDWKYVWLLRLQSCFFKGRYIITCLRDVPKKARAAIQTCTRESFKLNFIQKKKVRGFYVQWLILITCNKPNIHSFSKYFVYFQAKHTFFFCCRLGMAVGHIIPTTHQPSPPGGPTTHPIKYSVHLFPNTKESASTPISNGTE